MCILLFDVGRYLLLLMMMATLMAMIMQRKNMFIVETHMSILLDMTIV